MELYVSITTQMCVTLFGAAAAAAAAAFSFCSATLFF